MIKQIIYSLLPLLSLQASADLLIKAVTVEVPLNQALPIINRIAPGKVVIQKECGAELSTFGWEVSNKSYLDVITELEKAKITVHRTPAYLAVNKPSNLTLEHPSKLKPLGELDQRDFVSFKLEKKFKEELEPSATMSVGPVSSGWTYRRDTWSWFHYRGPAGKQVLVFLSMTTKIEPSS
jgi:hypothetical protein